MKVLKIVSNYLESNTFILSKEEKAIIFDAGAEIDDVKKATKGMKVVAVFLTHGHFDHALNAVDYSKEFDCKVYINEKGKKSLENPECNYGEDFKIEDFSNFEFLSGDGKIDIEGFEVQYYHCPGHSECLNSYLIEGELFVGDCIFRKGIGRCDLITSNKKDMLESLKKLSKLKYKKCHCGHYEDSDYESMKKNVDIYIKYFSR